MIFSSKDIAKKLTDQLAGLSIYGKTPDDHTMAELAFRMSVQNIEYDSSGYEAKTLWDLILPAAHETLTKHALFLLEQCQLVVLKSSFEVAMSFSFKDAKVIAISNSLIERIEMSFVAFELTDNLPITGYDDNLKCYPSSVSRALELYVFFYTQRCNGSSCSIEGLLPLIASPMISNARVYSSGVLMIVLLRQLEHLQNLHINKICNSIVQDDETKGSNKTLRSNGFLVDSPNLSQFVQRSLCPKHGLAATALISKYKKFTSYDCAIEKLATIFPTPIMLDLGVMHELNDDLKDSRLASSKSIGALMSTGIPKEVEELLLGENHGLQAISLEMLQYLFSEAKNHLLNAVRKKAINLRSLPLENRNTLGSWIDRYVQFGNCWPSANRSHKL